jgi:hypothetical protein
MIPDGIGTQVPGPVGVIRIGDHFYTSPVTERHTTISTNSFLFFGFRPEPSVVG